MLGLSVSALGGGIGSALLGREFWPTFGVAFTIWELTALLVTMFGQLATDVIRSLPPRARTLRNLRLSLERRLVDITARLSQLAELQERVRHSPIDPQVSRVLDEAFRVLQAQKQAFYLKTLEVDALRWDNRARAIRSLSLPGDRPASKELSERIDEILRSGAAIQASFTRPELRTNSEASDGASSIAIQLTALTEFRQAVLTREILTVVRDVSAIDAASQPPDVESAQSLLAGLSAVSQLEADTLTLEAEYLRLQSEDEVEKLVR